VSVMDSAELSKIVVEAELPPVHAYAQRHGWIVRWNPEKIRVVADGTHPADSSPARLGADVHGYKAAPPIWRFLNPSNEDTSDIRFPRAGTLPEGKSSIFHSNRVICAPFNRLAYNEHGGPHGDWGGPSAWLLVRGHVRATCLAEMLAEILVHLKYSPGWM
jgi:hypothetical protein